MRQITGRPGAILLGAAVLLGTAGLAGCASPGGSGAGGAATAGNSAAVSSPATAGGAAGVVVVNCTGQDQVRPASFVLTCADANDSLTGVHWVSWGSSEAFGSGTEQENTCTPSCAAGKFVSYPALVVLWRPEPLPGHPGVKYFSRVTRIYTGNRPPQYNCQGTRTCYPLTSTTDLWSRAI